jgi:hypothetical protein
LTIILEFITGVSLGIEYFEEEEAWIVSLLIGRIIFLPDIDE